MLQQNTWIIKCTPTFYWPGDLLVYEQSALVYEQNLEKDIASCDATLTPSLCRLASTFIDHPKKNNLMMIDSKNDQSPAELINARIAELGDWRGKMLSQLRALIKQADPEVIEEWKWRVPVWSHDGLICTGETYKNKVKITFAHGAALEDPSGLFNSSLNGNTRRAIDFHEGEEIDEKALRALIHAAVTLNVSRSLG
ncbi:MAG TPA: DUF1801 domain-containing protein [Rhodothermales bacterium]|nr:DUF1801 domain-containing protein [Rhodothermales bacterium]